MRKLSVPTKLGLGMTVMTVFLEQMKAKLSVHSLYLKQSSVPVQSASH